MATAVLSSTITLSTHPPTASMQKININKRKIMKAAPLDVLSLFFSQYQTFEERFGSAAEENERRQVEAVNVPKKEDKGKEKMTEEEEAALLAEEEEESGEEGLVESINEDLSIDDDLLFDEDEASYYFDLEEFFDGQDSALDYYEGYDFDMVEDKDDLVLEERSEEWERRLVSCKLGGHVVRRHSRAHKKPRVRADRWVNARDERKRCERQGLVFNQVLTHKANATRGLEYRFIDYHAIRESVIVPSTSAPPPSTTSAPRSTPASHNHNHNHSSSSSSRDNNGRIPSYEREVTSAIDRGSVVQCGLSAQQLNDLLNRELTPEDYELLLMLDTTVKPKTLSVNLIDSFPSRTVAAGSPLCEEGERCAICMSSFEVGEGIKELPRCQHSFHAECIVQWLSTASTKCPLCGCSLES